MSMTYKKFKEAAEEELRNRLGSDYEFKTTKVPKNNGIILDGLSVRRKDSPAAPVMYMEHYYTRLRKGESFDSLMKELAGVCRQGLPPMQTALSVLNDFSKVKDKIVYSLIRTDTNEEILKDVPSVSYLDLSIVFYVYLEENRFGQIKALIRNNSMEKWGTTADELYLLACRNTPRLLPKSLETMRQVLKEMMEKHMGDGYEEKITDALLPEEEKVPMYVLSNAAGINGAAAILYPGALKAVADREKADMVILPSSIHEVVLVPYNEKTVMKEMDRMVYSINREHVILEDRLSDHAYLYSRAMDKVSCLSDAKAAQVG